MSDACQRYFHVFCASPAELEKKVQELLPMGFRSLPCSEIGEAVLLATADSGEALGQLREELLRRFEVCAETNTQTDPSLARAAVSAMKQRGWTCATCESLTGGLIAATLVEVPGASDVVRGGLVTYQTDTKTLLAGVPAEVIEKYDVVSAEVAIGMARGTRERLGVDIAVSATGLAGPGGGTPERPVGTVFVGVSTAKETRAVPLHLTGDRAAIRRLTVKVAINEMRREAETIDMTACGE